MLREPGQLTRLPPLEGTSVPVVERGVRGILSQLAYAALERLDLASGEQAAEPLSQRRHPGGVRVQRTKAIRGGLRQGRAAQRDQRCALARIWEKRERVVDCRDAHVGCDHQV